MDESSRWRRQVGSVMPALLLAGVLGSLAAASLGSAQASRAPASVPSVSISASAAQAQPPAVAATALAFTGVTVVDVTVGRLVLAQTVVVSGHRVRTVGPASKVRVPRGAQVIDARGKYLIPGLWDLHVHPGRLAPLLYPLLVAHGVTGIRDPGSPVPLDTLLRWRREILAGTRVGPPRQLLSGQSIAGGFARAEPCKRGSNADSSYQTCVNDSADARRYVDSLKAAGADMLKPRELTPEMYYVIAAEARRVGIPFGGHAERVNLIEAADSGAVLVDHRVGPPSCPRKVRRDGSYWGGDFGQCEEDAKHFRRTGTWFVPTLAVQGGPLVERLANRAREFWAGAPVSHNWLRDSLGFGVDSFGYMAIAERVGQLLLAGTDGGMDRDGTIPPGISLHAELAMYVAEGMTPLATLNPAKFLHGTDSLGTVAPGKLADLVLLDADPLADIRNTTAIRAVVANGRYFDRAALDRVLAEVQAKYKAMASKQAP
jgi:hypothetical protein